MTREERMTREEHFRAHMYDMSPETRKMFEEMLDEISEFEDEKKSSKRTVERLEEQVYFANELVVSLDEWAKTDLSKPKRAQYQTLRDNSQFET